MKYRIEVWRVVKDAEFRVLEVEADSKADAIAKAETIYDEDDFFWEGCKSEPYDSGGPIFDVLEPT